MTRVCPKPGWEYAIDARIPEPNLFEVWLLGQVRAGRYPHLKYFNINLRHWNRAAVKAGKPWGYAVASDDDHLHMSFMPGYERARSTILADFETFRTTQGDDDMPSEADLWAYKIPIKTQAGSGRYGAQEALWEARQHAMAANQRAQTLITKLDQMGRADAARDALTLAAIQAITRDGGPDAAPIVAAIRDAQAKLAAQYAAEAATARAEVAALKAQLAAAGNALAGQQP